MSSTPAEYLSAFKKKHYDDLPDYEKGVLDGRISAHLSGFIVTIITATYYARYYKICP